MFQFLVCLYHLHSNFLIASDPNFSSVFNAIKFDDERSFVADIYGANITVAGFKLGEKKMWAISALPEEAI